MERDNLQFGIMEDDADHSFQLQLDPWKLPPYFFLRHKPMYYKKLKNLRTPSGFWREIEGDFIAIRSGDKSCPSYQGVRRTLEFYLNDGSRTDWLIHDYQHLIRNKDEAGDGDTLLLEDDVVLCKVFKKGGTDHQTASSLSCQEVESCVKAYKEAHPAARCGLNEDLGAHCHPDGKSDNVWKHFTKIHTNDPAVVYAACHHCDNVLKAHSMKHGTNQLKRHMSSPKCRSSCGNPSTDEDREMLHHLRRALGDLYEQKRLEGKIQCQEVNADLTQLNPWVLGNTWYVTTSLNRQTNEGCWEEIDKEFTAIRAEQQQMQGFWMDIHNVFSVIQNDDQMQMQVPQYMGLRRTLEFHLNQNGSKLKTGWIMFEYQQVDDIKPPALFLQGDMVIRKVFRYDKDAVTAIFSDFDRSMNGDNGNEECYNGEGVNMDFTPSTNYKHGGGDRKRKRTAASKRTSKVWLHFTEILTADHDVVYAVCHHCDRGYSSGRSTNGTSHLWRHNKSCTSKRRRTENANDATTEWEAEIWPRFLLLKNYGETEHQASGMC